MYVHQNGIAILGNVPVGFILNLTFFRASLTLQCATSMFAHDWLGSGLFQHVARKEKTNVGVGNDDMAHRGRAEPRRLPVRARGERPARPRGGLHRRAAGDGTGPAG